MSAVIPTYNRAHLLARAIETVRAQTSPPDEIVVVDDGSTDDTEAVVAAHSDVRYVSQSNAGPSSARNRGVEAATHPWVAFLDSDDTWFPDHLARMRRAIAATSGAARFYFGDLLRPDTGAEIPHWQRCDFSIAGDWELTDDAGDWVLLPRQPTMLQASVISRAAFRDAGGLWTELRLREDNHLFIRLGLGGPGCAVAGLSTTVTADDVPENRLFAGGQFGPRTKPFEELTVKMYGDLVRRTADAPAHHRAVLRRRLKGAHFILARHARGERDWPAAARHVLSGVRADPSETARSLAARLPGLGRLRR